MISLLLGMIRREIINEELRNYQNKVNRGLPSPQMQRGKDLTFNLMDHQVKQSTSLNRGEAFAAVILSAFPTLSYDEVNPSTEAYQGRPYQRFPHMGRSR